MMVYYDLDDDNDHHDAGLLSRAWRCIQILVAKLNSAVANEPNALIARDIMICSTWTL